MRSPPPTLILTRRDIARMMTPRDYLEAVETGFRASAAGRAASPMPMHLPAVAGGFHAKGATIALDRDYAVIKFNGNFPGNRASSGLPTIQGTILLCDGANGSVLAIMDSIEVTLRRTAAASALAARYCARPDSRTLLVCGCGDQGRAHLTALADVLPLTHCHAWDGDPEKAQAFALEMSTAGVTVEAAPSLRRAAQASDVIATCTTARAPFLDVEDVRPGTFIAAVGADNPDKNEIAPSLMATAAVVADSLTQCGSMGDLRHALEAGVMTADLVRAELGELVAGVKQGRQSDEEILIFDSTGTALQDAAAAVAIYQRCRGRSLPTVALGLL